MSRPLAGLLEVIALDADDARAAEAGGADRLELASGMHAGGLTPDVRVFAAVRAAVSLPVRVMLRATDGYTAGDLAGLCARAADLCRAGADEFVLGFLDADGGPDLAAVGALVDAIDGRPWTFHRAIDRAADRAGLRRALTGMPGLDTYLSGGTPTARGIGGGGLPVLLAEASAYGGGAPALLAGGGLRTEHIPPLRAVGVHAFHVGSPVRPAGWAGPVDAAAVQRWRRALDA